MHPLQRHSPRAGVLLTILAALLLAGCDEDCEFNDVDVAGHAANPDGVPYPAGPFGAQPRQGATPGDILPNFVFRGYRNGDTSGDPVTVSLADLYDPTGQRQLVVHLMAAAMWCPVCHDQTEAMVKAHSTLRGEGAAILQAIIMGPDRNVSPDRCDLVDWMDERSVPFTVVLDVDARRIATVAPLTAVPWNALIDARTMEVLQAGEGAPVDYTAYVRSALEWVAANPR
ncbi:MAG: redoxin domain-containing protein [Deltaproteobacteria bacterium]|nr:redoxin domain-containing protein [Deltaproteobacteria bacterium]